MNLKRLRYFVTVVEEGSITSAARKLFIAQPPLSAQIKLLEEEMGCALFNRGARQTKPTEAGKVLYKHALNILSLSQIAREDVRQAGERSGSTIRIGMVSSLMISGGAEALKSFLEDNPHVSIEITEANTYEILEKLRTNIIHLGVLRTPFSGEGLVCEQLYSDTVVAAGKEELVGMGGSIPAEELAELPLIIYRRWEKIISSWFEAKNLPFKPRLLNDDARTTLYFARKGLGVGIIPKSVLKTEHNIVYREINEENAVSNIVAAYMAQARHDESVELLVEELRKRLNTSH